jgi:uncharacterized protein with beta-barrel porin domain
MSPFARLDMAYMSRDGYTESDAEGLNLKVGSQRGDYERLELGLKLNSEVDPDLWHWGLKLSWIYEDSWLKDAREVQFISTTTPFCLEGRPFRQHMAGFGGFFGRTLVPYNVTMQLSYQGEVGAETLRQSATLHVGYRY